MGPKTTFICDCYLREADSNLGWARVQGSVDELTSKEAYRLLTLTRR